MESTQGDARAARGDDETQPPVTHEPAPFAYVRGTMMGGGVRCSCGWVEETRANRNKGKVVTMRHAWARYRDHWCEHHPGCHFPERTKREPMVNEQLFDPDGY